MTNEEFRQQMDVIVGQARVALMLADGIDLDVLVQTCRHALDLGPFVDPTAWMRGNKSAAQNLALVEAFARFVRDVRALAPEVQP